jgi:lysophosphatidic acid acyltransferase/lysophosphatidylinositol acyltransferase
LNAEGTRFTPTKHEASLKFARERGLPELKHHLIPRTKGFTTSLPHLRDKNLAIYDIQLGISKNSKVAPTLSNLLVGKGFEAHLLVRRITLDKVPKDEEGAGKWLQDLFVEKDKLQESFHTYGDYFHDTGVAKVEPFFVKPRLSSLINTLGWATVIILPMIYFLFSSLFNGNLIAFSIGISILIAFYILMQKSIGMSKISEGSSYGATAEGAQKQ